MDEDLNKGYSRRKQRDNFKWNYDKTSVDSIVSISNRSGPLVVNPFSLRCVRLLFQLLEFAQLRRPLIMMIRQTMVFFAILFAIRVLALYFDLLKTFPLHQTYTISALLQP